MGGWKREESTALTSALSLQTLLQRAHVGESVFESNRGSHRPQECPVSSQEVLYYSQWAVPTVRKSFLCDTLPIKEDISLILDFSPLNI